MKTVLIDSSSAILLFKSGLFDHLANNFKVTISSSVYRELTKGIHPGAAEFRNYFQNRKTSVCMPQDTPPFSSPENDSLLKLDTGERDTILLFRKGDADFIIIDDGEGAAYCRKNRIPYINALLFPKILMFSGHIPQTECRSRIDLIIGLGRYSQKIIEYAMRCGKEDLDLFLV